MSGLKNLREAANNLDEDSRERNQLEKVLKKIGEKEGKGATIAFGDAGETDGVPNLGITNAITVSEHPKAAKAERLKTGHDR